MISVLSVTHFAVGKGIPLIMAGSLTVVPALTTRPSINLTSSSMVGAAEIKDIKLNCVQYCKVNVYIFIILIMMIITQFFLTLYR